MTGGGLDASAERPTRPTVIEQAKAWLAQDPDAETRTELQGLIQGATDGDSAALVALHDRFDERLEFGTAGLRGRIEAGPNRMNRVLVSQAAAGLAAYLLEKAAGEQPSIVIGYDGRKNSRVFAEDTAELMAGAGVRAILLPRLLPTPLLAFAVRHLDTSAGVMVTASHNPPQDNGYKVYLGEGDQGSQIVPPADAEIAAHILRVAAEQSVLDLPRGEFEIADEEVVDEYVRLTAALATSAAGELRFVYTAMHGVGWETARRVFETAGFGEAIIVQEQIEPDAAFPTVAFPNPEEPRAMDLAFARAAESSADFVIANDPDADRLAVAIPDGPADAVASWRRLSGNEVGYLLGWRIATRLARSGREGTLAASIVSSPALQRVAEHYRLDYVDTLTGFKWVSRAPRLAFGFEEALGYLVDPEKVRDKDGISAAVEFLALMRELKAAGKSLLDHENEFAEKFGAFASSQISIRVDDLAQIAATMNGLRQNLPTAIGTVRVDHIDDFIDGFEQFPAGDILRIWLIDGSRVILRPSGTEPKLKVYIDASSEVGTGPERRAAAERTVAELDAAMRELLT
ncbi:MAG TPA: phospho-sugar mutase [Lacisediminihabitans sp.]|nr:phospho-sugar mutase [Lacisediminihabitans sp.]HXD61886.1 phospho-sugar mutase [Lacisediminihabitans sp.]